MTSKHAVIATTAVAKAHLWMVARLAPIAGASLSKQRKRLDLPPAQQFSVQEWEEFFSQPPALGGCNGSSTEWATHCQTHDEETCEKLFLGNIFSLPIFSSWFPGLHVGMGGIFTNI